MRRNPESGRMTSGAGIFRNRISVLVFGKSGRKECGERLQEKYSQV